MEIYLTQTWYNQFQHKTSENQSKANNPSGLNRSDSVSCTSCESSCTLYMLHKAAQTTPSCLSIRKDVVLVFRPHQKVMGAEDKQFSSHRSYKQKEGDLQIVTENLNLS